MMNNNKERQVRENNYHQASLEQYKHDALKIWPTNIALRPATYIWLHVVGHAANMCEGIRLKDWRLILNEASALNLWWLVFVGKLNALCKPEPDDQEIVFGMPFGPTQVIWHKYPRACPVELGLFFALHTEIRQPQDLGRFQDVKEKDWEEIWNQRMNIPCGCLVRKGELEGRSEFDKLLASRVTRYLADTNRNKMPRGIRQVEKILNDLFRPTIDVLSLEEIGFHFMEEVGEVSRVLSDMLMSKTIGESRGEDDKIVGGRFLEERKKLIISLEEELADVFSWTMSIVAKTRLMLASFDRYFEDVKDIRTLVRKAIGDQAQNINIAEIIWRRNGINGSLRCHECKGLECTCYDDRLQLLIGAKLLPWMVDKIHEAIESFTD